MNIYIKTNFSKPAIETILFNIIHKVKKAL